MHSNSLAAIINVVIATVSFLRFGDIDDQLILETNKPDAIIVAALHIQRLSSHRFALQFHPG